MKHQTIAWGCILLAATSQALVAGERCFPTEARLNDFDQHWYCGHLRAAGLRDLSGDPSLRFTYLPTFSAPRFVWVSLEGKHTLAAVVHGVVLSGKGGYEPGRVARRTRRKLTTEEWRLLRDYAANAAIWRTQDADDPAGGMDGSRWILEGRMDGTYRFRDVWTPDRPGVDFGQFVEMCTYMLQLAGIKPWP